MRDVDLLLGDILDAVHSIQTFTEGLSYEEFRADDLVSSAVVQKFEVIGEAAKNIPKKFREEHSNIPWEEMAGMRDRLIHGYFEVDLELVWKTVQNEIPELQKGIKSLVNK